MKLVKQFSGVLALVLQASSVFAVQTGMLPEWVSDQSDDQKCAVGVAAADAINPSDIALKAGVLELGMMRLVKVDGVEKTFREKTVIKNVKQLSRVTRLLAETSSEKVIESKNWKSAAGDYFALVCVSDKGQGAKATVGILKSYTEENELNASAKINQSLELTIDSQTKMDVLDEFSYVGHKSRWLAQVKAEAESLETAYISEDSDELVNVIVAEAHVREGKLAQAYLQLLAQSRHALANQLSVKVREVVDQSRQDTAPEQGVNKSVTSEVLKNTLVEKVYYDKLEGSIYMIMTHHYSNDEIRKISQRKMGTDKKVVNNYQASAH